jgi:hypothetical protein
MGTSSAKIDFFSLLTALILFLLPWTNVTCAGQRVATQTGLQAAYGGVSEAQPETTGPIKTTSKAKDENLAAAWLVAIAGILVLAGVAVSLQALVRNVAPAVAPGLLAGVALLLLGIQAIVGFPIGEGLDELSAQIKGELRAPGAGNPISIDRTPWFWLELIALAVPVFLFWNEKKKLAGPPEGLKPAAEVQRD